MLGRAGRAAACGRELNFDPPLIQCSTLHSQCPPPNAPTQPTQRNQTTPQYPFDFYPPFASGCGFALSRDLVRALLAQPLPDYRLLVRGAWWGNQPTKQALLLPFLLQAGLFSNQQPGLSTVNWFRMSSLKA